MAVLKETEIRKALTYTRPVKAGMKKLDATEAESWRVLQILGPDEVRVIFLTRNTINISDRVLKTDEINNPGNQLQRTRAGSRIKIVYSWEKS